MEKILDNICQKYDQKDWIIKEFDLNNFFYSISTAKRRCRTIELLSDKLTCIPNTTHIFKDNYLFQIQKKIKKNILNTENKIKLIYSFSKQLDTFAKFKFVHGDINYKNIIFNMRHVYLLDSEPYLKTIINEKIIYKVTKPYFSFSDLKQKKITSKTDKIGFFFFLRRIFLNTTNVDLKHTKSNDEWIAEYTGVENDIFFSMTFEKIFIHSHNYLYK